MSEMERRQQLDRLLTMRCECRPEPVFQSLCDYCNELPDAYVDAMAALKDAERAKDAWDEELATRTAQWEDAEARLTQAVEIAEERAALWRSHGGAQMAFPYSHLTVEGECDLIASRIRALAESAAGEGTTP